VPVCLLSAREYWTHYFWSAGFSSRLGNPCFYQTTRLSVDNIGWRSGECILAAPTDYKLISLNEDRLLRVMGLEA
jgi:hypothetical protein